MKITVLAGGISPERDVSLKSGEMVAKALKERGHEVALIDVYLGTRMEEGYDIGTEAPDIDTVRARKDKSEGFFGKGVIEACKESDIVFMALHGADGENGKVQAALDLYGVKYTGAGYLSCALAMDKDLAKKLFANYGVPVPEGIRLHKSQKTRAPFLPCVIKPASGGSSVGVTIAHSEEDFDKGLEEAFKWEEYVLVERFIKGREFSVGVIEYEALPSIEIVPLNGFYDYKNKYTAGSTTDICPSEIPEEIESEMRSIAVDVCKSLGIDTYSRMDFILEENSNSLYCLEANTLPGMTPFSLMPQEAAQVGMSYGDFCEKIIEISLKKYE